MDIQAKAREDVGRALPPGLTAQGEAGRLLTSRDWSSSSLGPPQDWPASLRTVVALMLGSKFPMFVAWGSELVFLYNDAYGEILGEKHPSAFGGRFADVWREIWADIEPLVSAALRGEATFSQDMPLTLFRRGFEEQTWFTFSYSPVHDDAGAVAGMFCACTETTGKVLSERRQAFQLRLNEALRSLDEPGEIMDAAVRVLGEELGANRVGYSVVNADGRTISCESCYADGVAPLLGEFRLEDFGADSVARQLSGDTEVCEDVEADPGQVRETWAAIDTRAFLSAPLVRDGRLRASLYVNFRGPRRWRREEIDLAEHTAARTWDAIERAQAQMNVRESEARFRNVADHAPMMMWVTDAEGRCTYLNRRWYEFTGQTAADALGFGWLDAIHADDRGAAEEAFLRASAAHEPFRLDYRLRREDGAYRWAMDAAAPRFDDAGHFLGYVGSVVDVQEEWEAQERARNSEERLRALMNAMPAFVWLATPDGELHYFNDRWYDYTGQTREEALPNGWATVLHPDDAERTTIAWDAARRAGADYEIEMRYRRRDGVYRWHVARAQPVRDAGGVITTWLGVSFDTHEHRMAAEHQALLINELNHRVKNTLATVQAMAAQTVRGQASPEEVHEAFTARLMALSAAHNVLTEQRWAGADLREVVTGAVDIFGENRSRFSIAGPSVWLPAKTALGLAMALHELGTNAIKYGALSLPGGRVELSWAASAEPDVVRLDLVWREVGGPPVSEPARRGFGSRLLERGLSAELDGSVRLQFRPEGLVCALQARLSAATAPDAWSATPPFPNG